MMNQLITLLLFEGAEPRDWDDSWKDDHVPDTSDRFRESGQLAVR